MVVTPFLKVRLKASLVGFEEFHLFLRWSILSEGLRGRHTTVTFGGGAGKSLNKLDHNPCTRHLLFGAALKEAAIHSGGG